MLPRRPKKLSRKPAPSDRGKPSPTLLGQSEAGPRPVSGRQQAGRDQPFLTGRDIIDRAVPQRTRPAALPAQTPADGQGPTVRHVRDAETTRLRRRRRNKRGGETAPRNRRRINYPLLLLRGAAIVLFAEVGAALLLSPRFYVRHIAVEGNVTVPTARLVEGLRIGARQNLLRLPTGKLRGGLLAANPPLDDLEIHRRLPGTVTLIAREREAWASVCLPDSQCYTIDRKLVPFRTSEGGEEGLPRLQLASGTGDAPVVTLGKPMTAPGLDQVSRCLAWATAHRFALDSVSVDPQGKLCLNRVGGVAVLLGSGADLDKKLNSLSLLLDREPTLREGGDIAYVNLYAYNAPALMPRATAEAQARAAALAVPPLENANDAAPVGATQPARPDAPERATRVP